MPGQFADGPSAEPGWRSRARAATAPVVVWVVWGAATIAMILFIRHYGRNVPYFEDFLLVPVMAGHEPLSLKWAAEQSNEHRPVVPKLILGSLLRTVPDFRGLYLNAGGAVGRGRLVDPPGKATARAVQRRGRRSATGDPEYRPARMSPHRLRTELVVTAWISLRSSLRSVAARVSRMAMFRGGWAGRAAAVMRRQRVSHAAAADPLAGGLHRLWLVVGTGSARARAIGVALLMTTSAIVAWYLTGYVRPRTRPGRADRRDRCGRRRWKS